ncbi:MAG: mannitol-1-phosphate 5-dehydrogenase [Spirochaeta sp. LUC14_002_19_P3]|nr:MAG: mannitol-1-phosphate 5-dehydrogenase [Spirochaeta sp. LUC14_002_19_P3]
MKKEKLAILFGAGNIGRGFIGPLLCASGYKVVFADVQEPIIAEINRRGEYGVEVLGAERTDITVGPVRALHSDSVELTEEFANAELLATAVGPNILPFVAPAIVRGIALRNSRGITEPLNIIACENMVGGSSELARLVRKELSGPQLEYADRHIGFPDAAVDRIVPPGHVLDDPLRVRVEEFCEWIVDKGGFKGTIPAVEGMICTDKLPAYLERKLFTLNTGHAAAAYLGARKGYDTIGEAIADTSLYATVERAMMESGEVLVRRHHFDPEAHRVYIKKILARFANPALRDEITRVGRQPLRKLSREERLIKPLRGTLEYRTENAALIEVIAAALAYRNPADEQSRELEKLLSKGNLPDAISRITGLGEAAEERDALLGIAEAYKKQL